MREAHSLKKLRHLNKQLILENTQSDLSAKRTRRDQVKDFEVSQKLKLDLFKQAQKNRSKG